MSGVRALGHAVHPMLIVFPLGLLATSVIFDIVLLATYRPVFAAVSYWNIAAGALAGLVAALFGFLDWRSIPSGTRAKSVGAWHGITNVVVVLLFTMSWILRRQDPLYVPSDPALVLAWGGLLLALVSGWLGGELVERLGVGVHSDADLNAPSSLGRGSEEIARRPAPGTRT